MVLHHHSRPSATSLTGGHSVSVGTLAVIRSSVLLKGQLLLILQDHDQMSPALESFPQFTQGDQLLQPLPSLSTRLSPHHSLLPWDLSFCSHICLSHWPQNISRKRAVCYSSLHPRFLMQHLTPRYVTPVMTVDADKCVLLSQAILFLNK